VAFTCAPSVLLPLCPRSCLVFCLLLLLEVHCCYKCNLNPRARRPMSRSGGMLMLNKSLEASLWQSARLVSALSAANPAAEAHDSATRARTWGTATFCRSINRLHAVVTSLARCLYTWRSNLSDIFKSAARRVMRPIGAQNAAWSGALSAARGQCA
jgi:hypothetical protein